MDPTPPPASIDGYRAALTRLQTVTADSVAEMFRALAPTDHADLDMWLEEADALVHGSQVAAADLAAAAQHQILEDLTRTQLPYGAVDVNYRELRGYHPDRPPGWQYKRAADGYRAAIAAGVDPATALDAAARAAADTAATDITLAHAEASRRALAVHEKAAGIIGYRRMLSGESCARCAAAATRIYRVINKMAVHTNCDCGVLPVTRTHDPGAAFNHELVARLQAHSSTSQYWRDRDLRVMPDGTILRRLKNTPGRAQVLSTREITTGIGPTLEAVPSSELDQVAAWTDDELARARREYNDLRARMRADAADTEQRLRAELDRRLGSAAGPLAPPPRTVVRLDRLTGHRRRMLADGRDIPAEWEWWFRLDPQARKRLQKNRWVGTQQNPGAVTPDVLQDRIAREVGSAAGDDDLMTWWLGQTQAVDDARLVSLGQRPLGDVTDLVPALADEGWDVNLLAQTGKRADDIALDHILTRDLELASELAARALPKMRQGPAPWDLDVDAWYDELADIDGRLADIEPIGVRENLLGELEDVYPPEHAELMDRWNELTVPGLDPGTDDGTPLISVDPYALHTYIVDTARAAGLVT